MTLIKLVLLAAIVLIAFAAFRGSQGPVHKAAWRVYVVLVLSAAVVAVIFPLSTTRLANALGVGRGTDLVLYVLAVTVMWITVVTFRRLSELERMVTRLSRALAIRDTQVEGDR